MPTREQADHVFELARPEHVRPLTPEDDEFVLIVVDDDDDDSIDLDDDDDNDHITNLTKLTPARNGVNQCKAGDCVRPMRSTGNACKYCVVHYQWNQTVLAWMYVCVSIYIYIWTYVCMYVRMYACTYACMNVCMYVCMYVCGPIQFCVL